MKKNKRGKVVKRLNITEEYFVKADILKIRTCLSGVKYHLVKNFNPFAAMEFLKDAQCAIEHLARVFFRKEELG